MRPSMKSIMGAALLLGLLSEPVWAWGPATHIGLGVSVLEQLVLLPAGLAVLLRKHRSAFLYGQVAADVVFAKRLSRVKQFCHHWSTALRMLESSPTDPTKAFAYGYLSHLAADTVAHGKFVPRQVLLSQCSVNFGHLHWELRADSMETDETRRLLAEVIRELHTEPHYALQRHVSDTFLPFEVNRVLFQRMNRLAARKEFRQTVSLWHRRSRWELSQRVLQGYRQECVDRILSILIEGQRSPVLRDDPNGTSALMQVHVRKRELRRLNRRGIPTTRRLQECSQAFAPPTPAHEVSSATPGSCEATTSLQPD